MQQGLRKACLVLPVPAAPGHGRPDAHHVRSERSESGRRCLGDLYVSHTVCGEAEASRLRAFSGSAGVPERHSFPMQPPFSYHQARAVAVTHEFTTRRDAARAEECGTKSRRERADRQSGLLARPASLWPAAASFRMGGSSSKEVLFRAQRPAHSQRTRHEHSRSQATSSFRDGELA